MKKCFKINFESPTIVQINLAEGMWYLTSPDHRTFLTQEIVETASSTDPLGVSKPNSEWLTKRERFAMTAMHGQLTNGGNLSDSSPKESLSSPWLMPTP